MLPALDRVPVTSGDAFLAGGPGVDEGSRRAATMQVLGADLAGALEVAGVQTCLGEPDETTRERPDPARLAAIGRADGVDAVVLPELVAYGQVRRSWLWLLAAQGLVAGVAHGVIAARATGDPAAGWWIGAGEFALETVTWVGGALLVSRVIDPVIVRVWAIRTIDGVEIGRWTREGTRRVRAWLHRTGLPPRAERLRGVADGVFSKLVPKLTKRLARDAGPVATTTGKGTAP